MKISPLLLIAAAFAGIAFATLVAGVTTSCPQGEDMIWFCRTR